MKEVQKWADSAMFKAEESTPGPTAILIQGTPDPLGSIVAFSAMYTGKVIRSKRDVTDDERRYHLEEMRKTKLKAPLEAVNLHWMIEGVTRSFTHQMVRQRTAVYAQESLRFAVKEDAASAVALPPSLMWALEPCKAPEWWDKPTMTRGEAILEEWGGVKPYSKEFDLIPERERQFMLWTLGIHQMDKVYQYLVNTGIPQEDARGLLPHNITTRLNYHTNLRNYQDHAGNRLCTQAQFEWRLVWVAMLQAMRKYCTERTHLDGHEYAANPHYCDNWQWRAISELFLPVCYITGNCQFLADFDRHCSIRNRVMANADINRPSSQWSEELDNVEGNPIVSGVGPQSVIRDEENKPVFIGAIHPAEWLADAGAARKP